MVGNIYYAEKTDLPAIAKVHRKAFPKSLATAMGQAYVEKMLEWFLSTTKTYIFYYKNESDVIVGYCGALLRDGTLSTGSASGMLQHSFNEAVKSFVKRPWLLFHKEMKKKYKLAIRNILFKFFKIRQKNKKNIQSSNAINIPVFALVGIGVNPEVFSKGIGSELLKEFERKARELEITKMELTVIFSNDRAIKAYERNGWLRGILNGESLTMFKNL